MKIFVIIIILTLSRACVIIARKSPGHAFLASFKLVRDTFTVKVIMDFGALYIHPVMYA